MRAILAILMAMMMMSAKADELSALLKNKVVVYNGVCWLTKQGNLTFNNDKKNVAERCIVGMELPDESNHYVLILRNNKPFSLFVYNDKEKKQRLLWSKNSV